MMNGVIIKDELYGTIHLSEFERRIIDCSDFQRLRRIKQMALTYLVYPGATHTRFEHSLGTMHLASSIADKLEIEREEKEKLRLYALLHDIGHVAFSHDGERVLEQIVGSHEKICELKIIKNELRDLLKENYEPNEITAIGKRKEGQIVNADLGADRMDYLRRDAQNTGVAYGVIDSDRVINTLFMTRNELVIDDGGLIAAESLLIARFMMFSSVYYHHTVRIAGAMLNRAIQHSISSNSISVEEFLNKGDEEIMARLRDCEDKEAQYYANSLMKRELFKEVCSVELNDVGKKLNTKNIKEIEDRLFEKFKCRIIIDWPYEFFKPINVLIKKGNELINILELSALVSALKTNEEKRKKVLLLCHAANRETIKKEIATLTDIFY